MRQVSLSKLEGDGQKHHITQHIQLVAAIRLLITLVLVALPT